MIADSVELTVRGHSTMRWSASPAATSRCPGMMMAMVRLNVPSVFIYGGSILPGRFHGSDVTVQTCSRRSASMRPAR